MTFASALATSRFELARPIACIVAVALGASLALREVRAQDATPARTPPSAAVEHYNRGRAHYQAGRYRDAVTELEAALQLDPGSPNLVYNLARVYELLGEIERAIAHYERYRDMLPERERDERERVSGVIQRLQGARKHVRNEPPPARGQPSVVVRSERGVADGAFWTIATLSLAAFVVSGVSGGLAFRAERSAHKFVVGRDGDGEALYDQVRRADNLALASDIALGVGSLGALTSIFLYTLRTRPVIEPAVGVSGSGISLTLRGAL